MRSVVALNIQSFDTSKINEALLEASPRRQLRNTEHMPDDLVTRAHRFSSTPRLNSTCGFKLYSKEYYRTRK